ncbi:hypothetical protein D3C80_1624160 [compost metagenome]
MQASLQVVYATQPIERSEGFCENKNRLPDGNVAFVGVRQRPANDKYYFRQWHIAWGLVKNSPAGSGQPHGDTGSL